jgi:hypothetical protein
MTKTDKALKLAAIILLWTITIASVVLTIWLISSGIKSAYCYVMVSESIKTSWCPAWMYPGYYP